MKIAYLINGTFNSGGMERVLYNKVTHFTSVGCDVTIITTDQNKRSNYFELPASVKQIDLGVNYFELLGKSIPKRICGYISKQRNHKRELEQVLASKKFDIVVSMFCAEAYWLPEIKDGSRKVLEIHFSKYFRKQQERRGILKLLDKNRSAIDEKIIKLYDKFIVLSHEDKNYWGNLPNIEVIHNSTSFLPMRLSTTLNKRAIAVGRLTHQKGFNYLIDMWAKVTERHNDWKLDVYGGGEDEESLLAQIKERNLQHSVTIFPPTKQILEKMTSSSLYLMTSRYEGLPMVLIEAMSCGIPAVSFACQCGPRDIITDGKDGYIIESYDIEKMAEKVCAIIDNNELRAQMGKNARMKIEEKFTREVIMKKWEELFHNLLKIS